MSMTEKEATGRADEVLLAILTNHPTLFGGSALNTPNSAKQMALSVATFRQELIAQYQTQPA
ncbi:hypothetical protein ASE11_19020 [Hydrogenophaga sp. Root209]|uniref:hypothetical protein n=1 Tax=Hydrogenophaga sp. Root209 TaxID=1736490 RepID=UPI0006F83484|nr:hypothetical protein [Hydrogenophaga sp. Root209]KRC11501.1 hypothetical protein ASE11_19020 [Hydrogenophaga sp. Root209]